MRCILCRDKTKSFEYEVLKNLGLEVIREYEVSVFFCLETYKALVDSKMSGGGGHYTEIFSQSIGD